MCSVTDPFLDQPRPLHTQLFPPTIALALLSRYEGHEMSYARRVWDD